jgi:hypothetical protein
MRRVPDRLFQGRLRSGNGHEVRHRGVEGEHPGEGEDAGVRPQKDRHMSLRIRHQVQEPPGIILYIFYARNLRLQSHFIHFFRT